MKKLTLTFITIVFCIPLIFISTTVLSDLIKENSGNLYVNQRGGFGGMLTQLKYFNKPLKRNDINSITRQGPDPFMLPSVKISAKVDFDEICPTSEN